MKTKAKLVLALSVLTAGTAVAGATGTFAWFTTNRSATLTYSNIKAVSSNSKLVVCIGGITVTGKEEVTNYQNKMYLDEISFGGSSSFTSDVSSPDGKQFFKPEWKSVAGNNQEAYSVKDVSSTKWANGEGGYFTQYYIGVKNTGNTAAYVFLNENTKIKANSTDANDQGAKDAALASWSRVAIIDGGTTKTAGDTKLIFENELTGANKNSAITAASDAAGAPTIGDLKVKHKVGNFEAVTAGTTKTSEDGYLCKLDGTTDPEKAVTQYFIVSVWLEGTEADNQDTAIGGVIDVTLGLTAIETTGDASVGA